VVSLVTTSVAMVTQHELPDPLVRESGAADLVGLTDRQWRGTPAFNGEGRCIATRFAVSRRQGPVIEHQALALGTGLNRLLDRH